MKVFAIAMMACALMITLGCSNTEPPVPTVTVSNIARVMMHEPGNFTFMVRQSNKRVGQLHIATYNRPKLQITEDAEPNQPIWVEYTCGGARPTACKPIPTPFSAWELRAAWLHIHVHSVQEIDGAGWNHGKFGSGKTEVIE